jgi:hypothetical protein
MATHRFDIPIYEDSPTEPNEGSFDLLAQLQDVASALRSLTVTIYNDMNADFLRFITPAKNMHINSFKNLTSLDIPKDFLLSHSDSTTLQPNQPAAAYQLLPLSLEYLTILFVHEFHVLLKRK